MIEKITRHFDAMDLEHKFESEEAFGWKVIESKMVGGDLTCFNGHSFITPLQNEYVLARDTEMEHYKEIKALETHYTLNDFRIRELSKDAVNAGLLILLIILGLVPGIIYLVWGSKKQKERDKELEEVKRDNFKTLLKAKELLNSEEK